MIKRIILLILIILVAASAWAFGAGSFLNDIESRSFDIRMAAPFNKLQHNKDIVIVTIDDESLEILEDDYGRWPWDRSVYAKVINSLNKDNAKSIVFDLMFIGHHKGFEDKDAALIEAVKANDNVYLSMNFSNREKKSEIRLNDNLKINLENNSNIDQFYLKFTTVRPLMPELIEGAKNIGIINFVRDIDGISRNAPIFFNYNGDYYPYLAFKVASDYLGVNEFILDTQNNLIVGDKKIPLNKNGLMTLNWYGDANSFEWVSIWKVLKNKISPNYFKDKIVYIGATATSLYDTKSTPLSRVYPGVEIQTTALNNILDSTYIKRVPLYADVLLSLLLALMVAGIVYKVKSTYTASFVSVFIALIYFILATAVLKYFYLWIGVVYPILIMALVFTGMYLLKYIIKSRDLEYTYKLATTDGLTGLYNHRYFQEYLRKNIEQSNRYGNNFSLILIDIDFFKKFNDSYGHQAGDAVLKKVAALLKKSVRSSDLVARYGGEEMAVIVNNADKAEAIATAQKLCDVVGNTLFKLTDKLMVNVTISLGVAVCPENGINSTELIEFADQGLYRAKETGRNRVGAMLA